MATALNKTVGNDPNENILIGTEGNTWLWTPDGWDLTHSADSSSNLPVNGIHLDYELIGVKINPAKTALVIIDMQNIGLNKALDPPSAPPMYAAQDAIL